MNKANRTNNQMMMSQNQKYLGRKGEADHVKMSL
jgi:hypothetical protein